MHVSDNEACPFHFTVRHERGTELSRASLWRIVTPETWSFDLFSFSVPRLRIQVR